MKEGIKRLENVNEFLIEFLENINAQTKERDMSLCAKLEKCYLDITVPKI